MYIRVTKVRRNRGHVDEYLRLVESYREGGKVQHRLVCNIGRKDLLAPHADALLRILRGEQEPAKIDYQRDAKSVSAWDWGVFLVVRHVWRELGLERILDRLEKRGGRRGIFSDRVLALVANRLCEPTSEHGLARWLETDYVCDRFGKRWLPEWRDDRERLASKRPRVRVRDRQLARWYRTLDILIAHKKRVEEEIFLRLRTLFSLKADLVFFDITSTYFEGRGSPVLARHGYSRDGKPRNRQILVGVVMIDGWPIAHYVLPGNLKDSQAVADVLVDIQKRFGLNRTVFVGDRGMVTIGNIEFIRDKGHGYLVGLQRRQREEILTYIERATGPWHPCPVGILAREKSNPPQTLVQEVPSDDEGIRVFVVQSDERLEYERTQREKSMQRVREELEALNLRVEKGQIKSPEKIGAAAGAILTRNRGSRYFDWKLDNGTFRFFEHPVNFPREKAIEGKFLIQTEEKNLSPVQAVEIYKELTDVERAFSSLKDVIDLRPIFHQSDRRVEAHVFVASLAFLIHRTIEKKLKAAGLDFSTDEACSIFKTIHLLEFSLPNGSHHYSVSTGSHRAERLLTTLKISDRLPCSDTH